MAATKEDRMRKLQVPFNAKSGTSDILLCHILLPYSVGQTSPAQILESALLICDREGRNSGQLSLESNYHRISDQHSNKLGLC